MKIAVRMVLSILVAVVLATPILFATVPAPAGKQQDMLLKDAAKSTPRVSQAEESREEPPKEGASIVEPLKTTATVAPQPNPFLSLFLLAVSVALGLAAYGLAKKLQPAGVMLFKTLNSLFVQEGLYLPPFQAFG